jgi:hypothetical protein
VIVETSGAPPGKNVSVIKSKVISGEGAIGVSQGYLKGISHSNLALSSLITNLDLNLK